MVRIAYISSTTAQGNEGQSAEGRYITVLFIRKLDSRALIVTARDMDSKERRKYGKQA